MDETLNLNSYFNVENGVFSQRSELDDDYNYNLKSIILHQGNSPNSGHYTGELLFWKSFSLITNLLIFIGKNWLIT